MIKLELEFDPPTPMDAADFQKFMATKSIVQVTLTASDGDTFNITLRKALTTARVGNGPAVLMGKKLQ